MKPIIAVVGPTASGKSRLAVELAQMMGGEVVSCDSMQVYRGMDIGTAKPDAGEMQGIAHHMLDVADPCEDYSAAKYASEAGRCVRDILARGKTPVVCGGTGLYLNALLSGALPEVGRDQALRAGLEREWESDRGRSLLARLLQVDPQSAQKLHANDKKRIIRAFEILAVTGTTKSELDRLSMRAPPRFASHIIGLEPTPREYLYARIDARVDAMLKAGLLAEAERIDARGDMRTAAQAIGYKELFAYFDGEYDLARATELIKQRSRNYAKRQLTWFKNDARVHWISFGPDDQKPALLTKSTNLLRSLGVKW